MSRTTTRTSKVVVAKGRDLKRKPGDLERLRARSKKPVDAGDIPRITQAALDSGALRIVRRRAPAKKVSLTLRLDEDVVARFKAGGEGYQTRINDALREHLAQLGGDDAGAIFDQIKALLERVERQVS